MLKSRKFRGKRKEFWLPAFTESRESTSPLVIFGQGKWIILLCLTVGQLQNGRRTSYNSEIFWTLIYPFLTRFLTHYQTTNLNSSKLREFADDNFKFDKNGRKLSKQVENTVGRREIARYEQFLFFPQCFQKACFSGASKESLCVNGSKGFFLKVILIHDRLVKSSPFPKQAWFLCVCSTCLLKTLWTKEKLLVI